MDVDPTLDVDQLIAETTGEAPAAAPTAAPAEIISELPGDVVMPPGLAEELGLNDTPQSIEDEIIALGRVVAELSIDDLQGLASAHTKFEDAASRLIETGLEPDVMAAARAQASKAASLLECLILNDTDDAAAMLADAAATADVVVAVIEGRCPPEAALDDADGPQVDTTGIAADPSGGDFESFRREVEASDNPAPTGDPFPTASLPEITQAPAAAAEKKSNEVAETQTLEEDDLELVNEFVTESTGHLEQAEQDLLTLEENPADTEAIGSLFRAFHTIKGVAGFLNLLQIQQLAHATENMLDRAREGKLAITGPASDIVMASLDLMKQLIADVNTAGHGDKTIRPRAGVAAQADVCDNYVAAVERGETPAAPIAVKKAVEEDRREGEDRRQVDRREGTAANTTMQSGDGTVKVNTDRLDALIDMVGELVIAQSMVTQDVATQIAHDQRVARNVGQLGKIVRELQDLSMSLRMVQVGHCFRKMTRVVRDTARKAGKEAELVITGGDTELDRNVVDALGDPLVHMVRNSIDHGLEPADEREAAGKSRTGRVELKAYHKGGAIHIEIIDDGRGLNAEKIRAKAVKNGLFTETEAAALPDADVHKLIFHAGLSTADAITDISGRGVGMDVVKRNIEALRGRVDITSEPGKGSVFTIRLPLTLAVIDGLVVKVGDEKYILPITSIEQSLRPTKDDLSTVQGRGEIVNVRGSLLPLVRVHRQFGVEPRSMDPTEALVVIVTDNERRVCLLVDELLGQEQVVIKNLGAQVGEVRGVSGGAVLGDGNVSLILDVPGLIATATRA
jgi:two-component system chemotaxis sensor kinase CheA